jgi:hypothetical protein
MEIKAFLAQTPAVRRPLALKLLGVISEKDLRDAPGVTLLCHLQETLENAIPDLPEDIFLRYLLNPRVAFEWLKPYRHALRQALTEHERREFARNPGKIAAWIEQHTELVGDGINHYAVPQSPVGVLSLGKADRLSRDIFAVALCRSLGIPSRLEPGSQNPQFFQAGFWHQLWPKQRITRPSMLHLKHDEHGLLIPRYATYFSLGQWQGTHFKTLEYPFDTPVNEFPNLELSPGTYRLLSGIRLFNDDILTKQVFFILRPDQSLTLPVTLRDRPETFSSAVTLPPNLEIEELPSGRRQPLSQTLPEAGAILCFIRPGHEPSLHLLDDLARIRSRLEDWGGSLILILKERREADALSDHGLERLPKNIRLVRIPADQTGFTPRFAYPFCALVGPDLTIRFAVQGYRVGTDSHLLRALSEKMPSDPPHSEEENP